MAPADFFKTGPTASEYSEFGDDGVPTKDKEGKEIQKSAGKKLQKLLKVHSKAHDQLKKKAGDDIDGFIAGLRADLEKLSV